MIKIKTFFAMEISEGIINWEKLENKIHAALQLVGNDFRTVRPDTGEKMDIKVNDALTFKSSKNGRSYKIIQPRFKDGELWCSGLQEGMPDPVTGKPVFVNKPVYFSELK